MAYNLDKWASGTDILEEFSDTADSIGEDLEQLFDEKQGMLAGPLEGLRMIDLPEAVEVALDEALDLVEALRDKFETIEKGLEESAAADG